ncbi:MAG TPA: alpha/beta fold hydrolase [Allosphingosinicella sp.]|nr:alpha/beta fold hydrolase [Allosphingosinicella sp.]
MRLFLFFLLLLVAAPVAAQSEGFITTDDGVRLFYKVEGSGPQTLVVVHGGPGFSLESVRADFAPLARNRRVIYYDQRGNGRSSLIEDPAKLALPRHVADLEAVRRHFRLEKMTLIGNSWGGLLISFYAVAHPDRIERLILDVPASPTRGLMREMSAGIGTRAREWLSAADRDRLRDLFLPRTWLEARDPVAACNTFGRLILRIYAFDPAADPPFHGSLCAGPPDVVRRSLWVNNMIVDSLGEYDLRAEVRRVRAPVLVIHGVSDVIPLASSRVWAASYPDARLLLMRRSGHLAHVQESAAFFSAIETFLAGRWPAGAETVTSGSEAAP